MKYQHGASALLAGLLMVFPTSEASAHGFGGARGGGGQRGGMRGGGYGGGMRAGGYGGGMRAGGYGGGMRAGGYGGGMRAGGYGGGMRAGGYQNRTNFGGVNNRTNIGVNSNRTNIGVNNRTNIGVNNNRTNLGGYNANAYLGGYAGGRPLGGVSGRYYGSTLGRPYGFNPYNSYRSGWAHGYWSGHNNPYWGWRGPYWGRGIGWGAGWGLAGFGLGYGLGSWGLGWGLPVWGYGSSLYGMGYMPYTNPYYSMLAVASSVRQPPVYDYSRPIDTTSAPADPSIADPAEAQFEAARDSFKKGNYQDALDQANKAIARLPSDTTLHEFRGLCLFALGRYEEAAATLHAVLSVAPGWDWTTLIGLYPNTETYTGQLRALEAHCTENRNSAAGRFVLSYLYLTAGQVDAAVDMLKNVLVLKPNDELSAKLVKLLSAPRDEAAKGKEGQGGEAENVPPNPTPESAADMVVPEGATIAGSWTAKPAPEVSINLNIQKDGPFVWEVTQKGQKQKFQGKSTFADGILTLAQENKGPTLVGRVSWKDANHMTFRIVGDEANDPGLSFSK